MEKFGLELESSKSRLIEFGRFAEQSCRARGEHKPETFDFLGFTFYCSKNRKGGFAPKVQTSRKKFEQKVRAYKNWIYDNRNRKGQILRSTPNTAPLICGACNTQPEGLSTMA